MKILRKTMLIFSAVLLTTACSKSGIEEIDPNAPEHNDGTTKTLSLSVPAMTGETRAGVVPEGGESDIKDVWVLQYLDEGGKLFNGKAQKFTGDGIKPSGSDKTVAAELDDAASTVYVVANVGDNYAGFADDKVPQTLREFEELSYTFPAVFAEGKLAEGTATPLPMVGSTTIEAGATSVRVDLKRMVARIDFTVGIDANSTAGDKGNTTEGSDLKLISAQLEYVSNTTAFKLPTASDGRVQPAAVDDNFFGKDAEFVYGTAKTISVTKGEQATAIWYVPENLAGRKTNLEWPKHKGPANAPDFSTRIVVKGKVTYNGAADTDVSFYIYPGANATTDFNIERNKVYSITSNIKNLNPTDNRVQVHDFIDLSSAKDEDCANCYMIHEAGKYKFRCDVKGNGVDKLGDGEDNYIVSGIKKSFDLTSFAGCTATVIWSSTDGVNKNETDNNTDVIANAQIDGNYITFETPEAGTKFVEGNAVIVAKKVKEDGKEEIVWSWHIWSTAYNPDKGNAYDTYTMRTDMGLTTTQDEHVMRCNLGAIGYSADGLTEPTGVDKVYGLYYQWGRKDPFLRTNGSGTGSGSIASAIANPETFYTSSSDWTAKNDALWGNPGSATSFGTYDYIHGTSSTNTKRSCNKERGTKSMFDPCPAGWRVPPQYLWTNAVTAAGQAAGSPCYLTLTKGESDDNKVDRTHTYIAAGLLNYSSGALGNSTTGYYWSSSPYASGNAYAGNLLFVAGNVYPLSNLGRGYGFSVRCVQE